MGSSASASPLQSHGRSPSGQKNRRRGNQGDDKKPDEHSASFVSAFNMSEKVHFTTGGSQPKGRVLFWTFGVLLVSAMAAAWLLRRRAKHFSPVNRHTSSVDADQPFSLYEIDPKSLVIFDHVPHQFPQGETRHPFTQGLWVLRHFPGSTATTSSIVIESSGLYEESYLRMSDLRSGKTIGEVLMLDPFIFAEGIVVVKNFLFMLTWREYRMLVFSLPELLESSQFKSGTYEEVMLQLSRMGEVFHFVAEFQIPHDGWGIASDGNSTLWTTSGSDVLISYKIPWEEILEKSAGSVDKDTHHPKRPLPPEMVGQLSVLQQVSVTKINCLGRNIPAVNDLQYDPGSGSIWANRFGWPFLLEVDPYRGICLRIADFRGVEMYDRGRRGGPGGSSDVEAVMNGVALHPDMNSLSLLMTGKTWRHIYQVHLERVLGFEPTTWTQFVQLIQNHPFRNVE